MLVVSVNVTARLRAVLVRLPGGTAIALLRGDIMIANLLPIEGKNIAAVRVLPALPLHAEMTTEEMIIAVVVKEMNLTVETTGIEDIAKSTIVAAGLMTATGHLPGTEVSILYLLSAFRIFTQDPIAFSCAGSIVFENRFLPLLLLFRRMEFRHHSRIGNGKESLVAAPIVN